MVISLGPQDENACTISARERRVGESKKQREKLLSEVSKSLPEGDDLQKSDEERVLLLL